MKELHFDCSNGATAKKILLQLEKLLEIQEENFPFTQDEKDKMKKEKHSLKEIFDFFENSGFSENAINDAKGIFEILTEAECKIHNENRSEIHFHEIGRKENLLRILKIASLIEELNPRKISASPLNLGFGFIECSHGKLTIPAPATKLIIFDMETYVDEKSGELTTPTGAAIIKYYTKIYAKKE